MIIPVCVLVTQPCPTLCDPMDYIAHHASLSMGFSRQEYWNMLPFLPPGDLPDPGIEPRSPALQAESLPFEPPGNPKLIIPSCIHVGSNGIISLFLMAELHCLYVPHILYLLICHGHYGCFHVLAIVNSAAMNIGVHVSFRIIVLSGYIPRSSIIW